MNNTKTMKQIRVLRQFEERTAEGTLVSRWVWDGRVVWFVLKNCMLRQSCYTLARMVAKVQAGEVIEAPVTRK